MTGKELLLKALRGEETPRPAWLPFVGDGLCLAAGWIKLNWIAVTLWSAAGRCARYWLVAQGALW